MDAEQWRAQQRQLRQAIRRRRRSRPAVTPASVTGTGQLASVIVVAWNAAAVLGRCLEHLFAQDYAHYEVIVVDDGSSDETAEVARRAGELREQRVRAGDQRSGELTIVRSRGNRGCPHARNLGIAKARGEIVAFMDADGFAAPSWLGEVVRALACDASAGGVASTVFYEEDPIVINGAGGTVNRQGWAADLSMNECYERARIAAEALYPMGCGMALRRSAIEAVGKFDERMLNYYDDVDYGVRLWRAGYRVVVAADAWIDHAPGHSAGDSDRRRLLCERHRVRVVLKHTPARTLVRWSGHEARAFMRSLPSARVRRLRALGWNALRLPSVLASRVRLRSTPAAPERLIDPSWGDTFPAGVAPMPAPRPERAGARVDMADPASVDQLTYGWFPAEHVDGRSYRWASVQAAAVIGLRAPVKRLRLDYAHVPEDIGGVEVRVRRLDTPPFTPPVWSTRLPWQYVARAIENHPLALPAGDYEVIFSVDDGWREPPLMTRSLSLALASMAFEESFELDPGGLTMSSAGVAGQLVSGWYEAEASTLRAYRWAGAHAAAVVRLAEHARGVRLSYCRPPASIGALTVTVAQLADDRQVLRARLPWSDGDWHEQELVPEEPGLAPGDYLVRFDCERTWSNRDGRDTSLWGENRSLGFALSSLTFT